jgi:MFS family permease
VQTCICLAVSQHLPPSATSANRIAALHLNTKQVSLVSSGVPLGAVGGALMLGPLNEAVGRRMAIIVSLVLYTVGAALEAGAINFGMMVAGRIILGLGVGLEGGTVPVYVAESVSRKSRGNLVSLYQFMIAQCSR